MPATVCTAAATAASSRRRSEEHTSESSHPSISYAVFCLKKKNGEPTFLPTLARCDAGEAAASVPQVQGVCLARGRLEVRDPRVGPGGTVDVLHSTPGHNV